MKVNCTEITKEDTRVTRWLQGATTKDHRRALQGLQVEKNFTVSTNGFEIRCAPTPPSLQDHAGELIRLDSNPRVNGDVIKIESLDDEEFPDWQQTVPKTDPVFEIVLNGALLSALTKDMGSIKLEFYSNDTPIIIKAAEKFAVLMPMHFNRAQEGIDFNPLDQTDQIEESS